MVVLSCIDLSRLLNKKMTVFVPLMPRSDALCSCTKTFLSMSNVSGGRSGEIETPGTDDGWITVVSQKKDSWTKRVQASLFFV